jgi:hypothetical protein
VSGTRRARATLLRLLPPFAAAAIALAFAGAGVWRTEAQDGGPRMTLAVTGAGVVCDAPGEPPACTVPAGVDVTISIGLVAPPAEGYVAFQTELFYDTFVYLPGAVDGEVVWPDSAAPVRAPALPAGTERMVAHGDISGVKLPFVVSDHAGPLVELDARCPAPFASATLAVLPYDFGSRPLGAGLRAAGPGGGAGPLVPVKGAGTALLDLDGDTSPEEAPVAAALAIECAGAGPTPTRTATFSPTPTSTLTRTPTPTRTATATPSPTPEAPAGDASCDRRVTAIDAALILQQDAGLLPAVPCAGPADVNRDGRINSIDASLVLQLVAGLLEAL